MLIRASLSFQSNLNGHPNLIGYIDSSVSLLDGGVHEVLLLMPFHKTTVLQMMNERYEKNSLVSNKAVLCIQSQCLISFLNKWTSIVEIYFSRLVLCVSQFLTRPEVWTFSKHKLDFWAIFCAVVANKALSFVTIKTHSSIRSREMLLIKFHFIFFFKSIFIVCFCFKSVWFTVHCKGCNNGGAPSPNWWQHWSEK